jgi:hypothetical protein
VHHYACSSCFGDRPAGAIAYRAFSQTNAEADTHSDPKAFTDANAFTNANAEADTYP